MQRLLIAVALLLAPAYAQRPALNSPVIRFSDQNGKPLVNGKLYSYQAGTTTPLPTYSDATTGALNPNPIVLDSTGSATVFLGAGVYKFVLQNSFGAVQWTEDNIAQGMFQSSYVSSVFGRTGAVTAHAGDYTCSQVSGAICSLPTPQTLYNQTVKVQGAAAVQEPILNFIPGVSGAIYTFTASGGTGYTGAPAVTFTGGGCAVEPTGSVAVSGGAVTNPTITTAGAGCTTPPTPTFAGGGGTGATGSATLTPNGISCVDNPGATSTDCTFTLGSSGSSAAACTLTDQTSSRSIGMIYQNATNGLMYLSGAGNTSGSGVGGLEVFEGVSTPNVAVFNSSPTATVNGGGVGFFAAILPGYFYQIQSAGAVDGIQKWVEITGCGGGGGSGGPSVSSINVTGGTPLTGAVTLACGSGLSCTQSGNTLMVSVSAPVTPLSITSFTGCSGNLELGASIINPVCSATYTGTPTGASIANSDGISSPLTLSSPYTSGIIVGTFAHNTPASTNVTLTATGSSTQTATQTITWQPAIFGGLGTNVAMSTVTASDTTAVLSTSDVLARIQVGPETVDQLLGPYTPNNQYFYFLLIGGGHTFVDNSSNFPIPFDTPLAVSFVNAQGVTISMYLYKSSYPSGPGVTTNLKIAS